LLKREVNLIIGLDVFQIPSQETSRAEALIAACDSTALFFSSTVGSFTKEALCKLRGVSDESLLHLSLTVREHDPVKDARRLLQVQGGHGIRATLLDARVQLTQGPLYLYFAAESARTNFSLLDQKPLLALNCVDSVEITKVSCTDCISAFLSKFRAPVKWSLHTSIEDLLSCMHVRLILLCPFLHTYRHTVSYCGYHTD
jgi:hypothetical protein